MDIFSNTPGEEARYRVQEAFGNAVVAGLALADSRRMGSVT